MLQLNQLSLETARKLKAAGLRWLPQKGDWYYRYNPSIGEPVLMLCDEDPYPVPSDVKLYFAPRLDQLLAEIEKLGYNYTLYSNKAYDIAKLRLYRECTVKINTFEGETVTTKRADTPDEAAAQALLWILEQEKGGDKR